jgi:hypothetical protein
MRRWFIAAAAIILFPGTADAHPEWQEYVYADQQFAVSFPGEPEVAAFALRTPNGTVTQSQYSVVRNVAHFQVTVFDLLRVRMDGSTAVARAAYSLCANGAVKLDAVAEVQGNWGRDLEIATPDGNNIVAAVFFRNDRLYVIQAAAPALDFESLSADIIRFQQSLRFVGDPRPRRFAPDPTRSLQDIGGRIFGPAGG